jgi:hypothetical protein
MRDRKAIAVVILFLLASPWLGFLPLVWAIWLAFAPYSFIRRIGVYAAVLLVEFAVSGLFYGFATSLIGFAPIVLITACPLLFVRECIGPIDRSPTASRRGVRSLLAVVTLNAVVLGIIGANIVDLPADNTSQRLALFGMIGLSTLFTLTSIVLCFGAGPLRYVLTCFGLAGVFALNLYLGRLPNVHPISQGQFAQQFAFLCVPLLALRMLGYRIWVGAAGADPNGSHAATSLAPRRLVGG